MHVLLAALGGHERAANADAQHARANRVRAVHECDLRRRLFQARAVQRGEKAHGRLERGDWKRRECWELHGLRERVNEDCLSLRRQARTRRREKTE